MSSSLPKEKKWNIMFINTDQQRAVKHFPKAWVDANMKSLNRLKANGMEYTKSYLNMAPCWSNRAVVFSGMHPVVSQVVVLDTTLPPSMANFAQVMKEANYEVVYKGKWHLTYAMDQFAASWSSKSKDYQQKRMKAEDDTMEKAYGLKGWTSPDAGTNLVGSNPTKDGIANLGGGNGDNDNRVVNGPMLGQGQECVVDWLKRKQGATAPWCLFVSLVNPHDINVYPTEKSLKEAGYDINDFKDYEGFELPRSYFEDDLHTKPDAQLNFLKGFGDVDLDKDGNVDIDGDLSRNKDVALTYLKFYAHLNKIVDDRVGEVLDAMSEEQRQNTIIIRTADHGELGASHGGLREKMNNFYEEMANIPLVISNPVLFPKPQQCDKLVGQIDLLPTVADLVGLPVEAMKKKYHLQGISFADTLTNPNAQTQEFALFTFFSGSNFDCEPAGNSCIIYGIVSKKYKYAVYFSPANGFPKAVTTSEIPTTTTTVKHLLSADGSGKSDKKKQFVESYPGYNSKNTFPDGASAQVRDLNDYSTADWFPIIDEDSVQFEMYDLENDPDELDNMMYNKSPRYAEGVQSQKFLHGVLTDLAIKNCCLPIHWMDMKLSS